MKHSTVCVGSPDAFSAKKRAYSSTPVGFPIRNDLSAHSQGISGVFPTWVRTRRAPTYVRGLVIDYDSTSNHLPQDHTTPTNHLSDTTQSPLKPRTKPYTAPCQDQSTTRLSTPKRALIFAQIHPIFVEFCLGFAWDLLEVVHNQFTTHSTQLACSTIPTLSSQASPIKYTQGRQHAYESCISYTHEVPINTTQSSQASPINTNQSSQDSPIVTTQSTQDSPIITTQSTQDSPIVNVHSANDTKPTHQRHQADQSTTQDRLIHDTNPTQLGLIKDITRTTHRLIHDTNPTQLGLIKDITRITHRLINDNSFLVRSWFFGRSSQTKSNNTYDNRTNRC